MVAAELMAFILALTDDMKAKGDPSGRFDPPYTTLQVGTVEGGTAVNIIPKSCSFVWECRPIPGKNPDALVQRFNDFAEMEILPGLHEIAEEASITTQPLGAVPAFQTQENSPAETLALLLAKQNGALAASYGTEAGIFQAADIPTIVCGPGNILQAHRPNEFISIDQVEECTDFMHRLLDHVSA
jgi:acetylornithine deacetylase